MTHACGFPGGRRVDSLMLTVQSGGIDTDRSVSQALAFPHSVFSDPDPVCELWRTGCAEIKNTFSKFKSCVSVLIKVPIYAKYTIC